MRRPSLHCGRAAWSGSSWCTRRGSTKHFDRLGVAYFRDRGFDAVATRAVELSDDPALVETEQVVDWVERRVRDGVDGVYLAGNGFRAAAAVDELARRTGRVVVSANQALLRAVLSVDATPER